MSGSFDHTIKIFDTYKNKENLELTTKDSAVTAMSYSNNICISGHEDSYIK